MTTSIERFVAKETDTMTLSIVRRRGFFGHSARRG